MALKSCLMQESENIFWKDQVNILALQFIWYPLKLRNTSTKVEK